MLVGMADAWDEIDNDDDVRCGVLTGAGGAFSSGMDLKAMSAPVDEKYQRRREEDPDLHWKALLRHYHLKKPLIAAVEGFAVAGGTEILQATDIRVAGEGATFGVFEAKRGLFPLGGSTVRLRRQIPYTIAMDILLTARPVSAQEALEIGLIGRVVPDGHALEEAMKIAELIAAERAIGRRGHQAVGAGHGGTARGRGARGRARDRLADLFDRGRARGPPRLRGEASGRVPAEVAVDDRTPVIAGIGLSDYPKAPDLDAVQHHALALQRALDDCGLPKREIDGYVSAGGGGGMMIDDAVTMAEYLGIDHRWVDGTMTGGSSFEFHVQHAAAAIRQGYCDTVLITYGSDQLSRMGRTLGTGGFARTGQRVPGPIQFEVPYGNSLVGAYAMVARRHMHEFGTTSEQLAEIAVGVREFARLNPNAMYRDPLGVDDVVNSRMIADPLHKLDCCVISDGGGLSS